MSISLSVSLIYLTFAGSSPAYTVGVGVGDFPFSFLIHSQIWWKILKRILHPEQRRRRESPVHPLVQRRPGHHQRPCHGPRRPRERQLPLHHRCVRGSLTNHARSAQPWEPFSLWCRDRHRQEAPRLRGRFKFNNSSTPTLHYHDIFSKCRKYFVGYGFVDNS